MEYRVIEKKGVTTLNSKYYVQYKRFGYWWYVKQWEFGTRLRARFSSLTDAREQAIKLREEKKIIIHTI